MTGRRRTNNVAAEGIWRMTFSVFPEPPYRSMSEGRFLRFQVRGEADAMLCFIVCPLLTCR